MLFLHVFLAYPSGRLEGRFEWWLVAAAYTAAIGLGLLRVVLGGAGSHNLVEVVSQPGTADGVRRVQVVVVSALILAGIGVLIQRRRGAGRPLRRTRGLLVGSYALALVLLALGIIVSNFGVSAAEEIRVATFGMIAVAPVVLLLGLVRARLARSTVGDLFVELREDPGPADLRDALARALRDPSLALAYWLPQFHSWADLEGRVVTLPNDDDSRATTLIERGGVRVAALLHDPALDQEPKLLDAVTAAAGIALENERLQVELRARLAELKGSRARIVDAGQRERQRLERNLHDGAQQRLIALSLELSLLEERLDADPDARMRLDHARREIATSLDELRDVARGMHPAVVSGHGLEIALEQLAARAPLPVRLAVAARRPSSRAPRGRRLLPGLRESRQHRQARERDVGHRRRPPGRRPGRGRGRRRRSRRRRHRTGLGSAGARGPRRGPRRSVAGVEPERRRDPAASGDPVRAVIAEDSVLLREGLERLLGEHGLEVVGCCQTAEDLLLQVRSYSPDVAIVDIRLPPTHNDEGMRAALEIRARHPSVGVLVLSQYVELGLAMKLLADSAEGAGYLLKDRIGDVKEFIGAVRRVGDGGSAIDPIIVSTLLSRRRSDDPLAELTPRERDVLELMAEGRSNQGIADKLVISLRAVEKYVSSIFGKLGLPSSGSDSRRVLAVLLYLRS